MSAKLTTLFHWGICYSLQATPVVYRNSLPVLPHLPICPPTKLLPQSIVIEVLTTLHLGSKPHMKRKYSSNHQDLPHRFLMIPNLHIHGS